MEPLPSPSAPNPMSLNEQASKLVIHPKHHPLIGGLALALGAGLSIALGSLLFDNYFPKEEDVVVEEVISNDSVPADWKTYTNLEYGFEFRYPADRTIRGPDISYSGATPEGISVGLGDIEHPVYDKERFELSIFDQSPQENIEEGACQSTDTDCITEYRVIHGERFIVNTFRETDGMAAGSKEKDAAIVRDGKLFHLYTGFTGNYYGDISIPELAAKKILFDKILSTFKFLTPFACSYQQVQCIRAPCPPVWTCESSGQGAATNWISYVNETYGVTVALPESWNGYTIVTDTWSATATEGSTATMKGPQLHIVHPLSTQQNPRQDIPIMVLSIDEWKKSLSRQWSFGAAPIGPSEISRNAKYVFALPARYNYAFLKGFEEVEMILTAKAITAF